MFEGCLLPTSPPLSKRAPIVGRWLNLVIPLQNNHAFSGYYGPLSNVWSICVVMVSPSYCSTVLRLVPEITPVVAMMNGMSPARARNHQSQFIMTLLLYTTV
jgi:hypothetical protein